MPHGLYWTVSLLTWKQQAVWKLQTRVHYSVSLNKPFRERKKPTKPQRVCVIEKTVFSQMLKKHGLGLPTHLKILQPIPGADVPEGRDKKFIEQPCDEIWSGRLLYHVLTHAASLNAGSNICHGRACSICFWVFLKAPCKAELIPLCKLFLRHPTQRHFPYLTREGSDSGCRISM